LVDSYVRLDTALRKAGAFVAAWDALARADSQLQKVPVGTRPVVQPPQAPAPAPDLGTGLVDPAVPADRDAAARLDLSAGYRELGDTFTALARVAMPLEPLDVFAAFAEASSRAGHLLAARQAYDRSFAVLP
jgi:hypothetical protein